MHWHHRPTIHSFSSCLQVFPWLSNYESVREWIHPPREERRTRQIWHFWQTYPTCASHGADFFSRKLLAVDFTSLWDFLIHCSVIHLFKTENDSVHCNVRVVPIMMLSTTLRTMEIHTCQDVSPASFLSPSHVQNRKMSIAESYIFLLERQLSAQFNILYRPVQAKTLIKWPQIRDEVQDALGGLDWIPRMSANPLWLGDRSPWGFGQCGILIYINLLGEGWVGYWKWIPVPARW